MSASLCRSCRAAVTWARTEAGRRIPLDAEPVEPASSGTAFVLRDVADATPLALAAPADAFPGEPRYRTHFASCPQAERWRTDERRWRPTTTSRASR
jgi:hypothetical protein